MRACAHGKIASGAILERKDPMAAPRLQKSATPRAKSARAGVADMTGGAVPRGAAQADEPAPAKATESSPTRKAFDQLLCDAAGIPNPRAANRMVNQAANTVYRPVGQSAEEEKDASFDTLEQLIAYKPKDVLEGMLVSQMVGTHNAAMQCLASAQVPNQSFEVREQMLKHAAKLMGIFTRQVEALDKHRNRGQQKITVEHVTVNAGGKAIIGDVGVGADASARAAHSEPLALTHNPGALAPVIDQIDARALEPVKVRKPAHEE